MGNGFNTSELPDVNDASNFLQESGKGIIMDDKPIVPLHPVFIPPPYDPAPDYSIWDEMSQR